jgi:hypothetical protein
VNLVSVLVQNLIINLIFVEFFPKHCSVARHLEPCFLEFGVPIVIQNYTVESFVNFILIRFETFVQFKLFLLLVSPMTAIWS